MHYSYSNNDYKRFKCVERGAKIAKKPLHKGSFIKVLKINPQEY